MKDETTVTKREHVNARNQSPQTFSRHNPMKRYLSLGLIALAFVAASLFTAKPASAAETWQSAPSGTNANCWVRIGGLRWPGNAPNSTFAKFIYCGTHRDTAGLSVVQALENMRGFAQPVLKNGGVRVFLFEDTDNDASALGQDPNAVYQNILAIGAEAGVTNITTNPNVIDIYLFENSPNPNQSFGQPRFVPVTQVSADGAPLEHIARHEAGHAFDFLRATNVPFLSQQDIQPQPPTGLQQGFRNLFNGNDTSYCNSIPTCVTFRGTAPNFAFMSSAYETFAEEFAAVEDAYATGGFLAEPLDDYLHNYYGCTYWYTAFNINTGRVPNYPVEYPTQCKPGQGGGYQPPPLG